MPMHNTFSLLTFNCFGGINWTTPRRLRSLVRELQVLTPTVVCLQEVQSNLALRLLRRTATTYPGHAYLPGLSAPLGSLLTLARDPLHSPHFVRYTTQGAWFGPTVMDQLTQKGMLISRCEHHGVPFVMINTHLVANYGANWQPESRAARDQQSQLQQLAATVCDQPSEAVVLVAGDFNIPRSSWLYDEFLRLSALHDPLAGDDRPTYRPFIGVPARYALPIDFVFIRTPPGLSVQTEAEFFFTDQYGYVGGGRGYLSDHVAVRVMLRWAAKQGDQSNHKE
jgi:endonuclease/exonuclease/phosphatase (EEP) superfamily protein YafD